MTEMLTDLMEREELDQRRLQDLMRLQKLWNLREKTFEVFDGQGFIKVVDVFGDDQSIVEAARLTAQSEGRQVGSDRNLLRYLLRHRHTTPIEFAEIKLHVRVPMDAWRQWIRHRTASVNEYSTRYSPAIDDRLATPPDQWRLQSKSNRQGSSGNNVDGFPAEKFDGHFVTKSPTTELEAHTLHGVVNAGEYLTKQEKELQTRAQEVYEERLHFGVAKEQARKDLPLSTFTEAYWKCDLHNLLHFLGLRMDSHAQKEIRDYANIIGNEIVAELFPMTWEAFCDYRLNATTLTAIDKQVIANLADQGNLPCDGMSFTDALPEDWAALDRCRERDECWDKLVALGLTKEM